MIRNWFDGFNLFTDEVYRKLNKSENLSLKYEQQSKETLNNIAIESGYKNYKGVLSELAKKDRQNTTFLKRFKATNAFVLKAGGNINYLTSDDLLRIFALSQNAEQRQCRTKDGIWTLINKG